MAGGGCRSSCVSVWTCRMVSAGGTPWLAEGVVPLVCQCGREEGTRMLSSSNVRRTVNIVRPNDVDTRANDVPTVGEAVVGGRIKDRLAQLQPVNL